MSGPSNVAAPLDWQSNNRSEWGSLYNAHPDPFAILGLSVDSDINEEVRNKAYRKAMPHVFERNALPPMTRGPTIPTWVQLNGAKDQMGTPAMIKRLRESWIGESRPTWNPSAPKGSRAAHIAPPSNPSPRPATPTRPAPPNPSSRAVNTPKKSTPKSPSTPTSQSKRPPPTTPKTPREKQRTTSSSPKFSPFSDSPFSSRKRRAASRAIISSSDESELEVESEFEAEPPSPSMGRGQRTRPLPAYVVDGDDYAEQGIEPPPPRRREAYASRTNALPVLEFGGSDASSPSNYASRLRAAPGQRARRHKKIFGVLLGTWARSTKPVDQSNSVYGSRDIQGRINRRASGKTLSGQAATNTGLATHSTSLRHSDVDYLPQYQGLTQQEVDDRIMPMLMEAESKVFGNAAKRQR